MEEYGTGDSQSFRVFPRESVADEDEESVLGKPYMLISIGGRLTLDYDENVAPFKGSKSPSSNTVQNSALQSPWASRHPSASMQV